MLKNIVNCKNCGAPLHYNLKNRMATCDYCSSEYHLDNLGIIEEYKVELDVFGKREKFYISNVEIENTCEEYRTLDGRLNRVLHKRPIIQITLINY